MTCLTSRQIFFRRNLKCWRVMITRFKFLAPLVVCITNAVIILQCKSSNTCRPIRNYCYVRLMARLLPAWSVLQHASLAQLKGEIQRGQGSGGTGVRGQLEHPRVSVGLFRVRHLSKPSISVTLTCPFTLLKMTFLSQGAFLLYHQQGYYCREQSLFLLFELFLVLSDGNDCNNHLSKAHFRYFLVSV